MKKLLFHAIGISMMLVSGLLATEVILRLRDEAGVKGAWDSFLEQEVPITRGTETSEITADPILGFKYNPALPEVNSLGIREKEIPLAKQPGKPRIIVIGDSVSVMCDWEWNPDKGYVPFLGQDLEGRAEVINAAISGYTTYQERLLLEHYLLPYKPDLVILQYTVNDNQEFLHRFDSSVGLLLTEEARRAYLPEAGDPLAWLPNWSYLAIRLRFLALQWRVKDYKYPWDKYPGFPLAWQDETWGLFEEQLVAIKRLVKGIGGQVRVLMVPFGPQFAKKLLDEDRAYVLKPQTKMAEICGKHGVPLIDVFPIMEENDGESLFYDLVHMTSEGHRIVADVLREHLIENELVPAG